MDKETWEKAITHVIDHRDNELCESPCWHALDDLAACMRTEETLPDRLFYSKAGDFDFEVMDC